MRRLAWFAGGVVTGAAGMEYARRKVTATARRLAPANVAKGAVHGVRRSGNRVADALREGRSAARQRERELRYLIALHLALLNPLQRAAVHHSLDRCDLGLRRGRAELQG